MDAGWLEPALKGGRQGVGDSQERRALAHHTIHSRVKGTIERLGIGIVVHVHLEALHLAIVRGHEHVPLQGQRIPTLLALQILSPSRQNSRKLGSSIRIILRLEKKKLRPSLSSAHFPWMNK